MRTSYCCEVNVLCWRCLAAEFCRRVKAKRQSMLSEANQLSEEIASLQTDIRSATDHFTLTARYGVTDPCQWRRSVVKSGVQSQSGQAIKLFQITPYVNDFQTLNNPGS